VPGAPGNVTINWAQVPNELAVGWSPPADGGSPITNYRITCLQGCAWSIDTMTPATSVLLDSMAMGVTYQLTVAAKNANGFGPASAPASFTTSGPIDNFSLPSAVADVAAGPDGNIWFTTGDGIGKISPVGVATLLPASIPGAKGITTGPDGNIWFTTATSIGKITTAGVVTTFTDPKIAAANDIAPGPDGNLWFTNASGNSIGKITTAGIVSRYTMPIPTFTYPAGIVAGPDGNMWFTTDFAHAIGRITPSGVISLFTDPTIDTPSRIAAGPDGNLWFTNSSGSIGKITTAGVVSNFTDPMIRQPEGIAAGPDGNLWFTDYRNQSIGKISTAGAVSRFFGNGVSGPSDIALGPDGNMWFGNSSYGTMGRFNLPSPPSAPLAVTAVPTAGGAVVSWSAPASDHGSAVTGYTVMSSPAGKTCSWTSGPLTCTVSGLTNGTPYTFTVTAANSIGPGPASAPSGPVTPAAGTYFHPLAPTRILDSRGPNGGWNAKLAGAPKALTVTGGTAAIPTNVDAVVMNVTATGGTANSFVTVYPAGTSVPNASNVNFAAGQTIPNLATVKVGAAGQVAFANAVGAVDVIADIVGYFDAVPADRYNALPPSRILDSRVANGGWNAKLTAAVPKTLQVRGVGGVPATADAVIMNVTVTGGTANSFVTAYPAGSALPNASNVNFAVGETIPNLVTVKVGTAGQVAFANAVGAVDVIADVVGYFDTATGDVFHALVPARLLDSRSSTGAWNAKLTAGAPRTLPVTGTGVVPAGATAVIGNTTITGATANSFVTVYPAGSVLPNASNVNFAAGQTIPNLTAVKIGTNGQIAFATAVGATDVIFDAVGYFAAA